MGKKKKKKKNKLKGQILSAAHTYNSPINSVSPAGNPAGASTNHAVSGHPSPSAMPAAAAAPASIVVPHINTDLRFFFVTIVIMIVILAGIFIWDQQSGIILQLGQKLYSVLGLS